MKHLWLLLRDVGGYDEAGGFVVRAETEGEARKLAARMRGDEGEDAWLNPYSSSCVRLRGIGPTGVILRDFNAG